MTVSNQIPTVPLSVSKEKKAKFFYEHGKVKRAFEAFSVASAQEEMALRKAEKHHQPQVGKSRAERRNQNHASNSKKRLEEAKAKIANQRAEAKREKARSRKKSKGRLRRGDTKITVPEDTTSTAPRKRVSFA